jgi:hypothetical protein
VVFGGNVEKCKVLKKTGRISVLLSSLRFSAKIAAFSAILGYARSVKDPFIKRRGLQLNSLQAFFFGLRGWLILRLGFYLMLVPSASVCSFFCFPQYCGTGAQKKNQKKGIQHPSLRGLLAGQRTTIITT